MGLFTDIYNSVARFFRQQEQLDEDASKSVATNRLKLVLMQDRTNLTPKILEQMRGELIDLLSRYVELDKELLDLNFEQEGDQVALMLSIPVIRAKDEDEIDAAIKAHNEALRNALVSEEEETEESTEETSESDSDTVDSSEEVTEATSSSEEKTEEEIAAEKTDAIAKELQNVPKIIKKKKVSAPENMSNNPFKPEAGDILEQVETSTEV